MADGNFNSVYADGCYRSARTDGDNYFQAKTDSDKVYVGSESSAWIEASPSDVRVYRNGVWRSLNHLIHVPSQYGVTCVNTTTLTTLATFSVPANSVGAAGLIKIHASGTFTRNVATTFMLQLKVGSNTYGFFPILDQGNNQRDWSMDAWLTPDYNTAYLRGGMTMFANDDNGVAKVSTFANASLAWTDTQANDILLNVQWSVASAYNQITFQVGEAAVQYAS